VRVFEKLGHDVEEIQEAFPDPGLAWALVAGGEVYAEIVDLIEEHRAEFGRTFLSGTERARELTPDKYGAAQRVRADLVNFLWRLFDRYDLLLTPTLATEAFDAKGRLPTEIDGHPVKNPLALLPFTYPFNLSGHPAATVRAGLTDAGLPAGLQIVAPRHREDLVLQASYAYERERPWNDKWPREIRAVEEK
jgi:aspartyl-tRNA(Asn)/glutamyl-tRNA(Gln) amidotransferase subunit A